MDVAFRFESAPYRLSGHRIKSGFHCHTVMSDGGLTPEETVARYRAKGYGCLGITDHRKVTRLDCAPDDGFVVIPSTENSGWPDIIGVGVQEVVDRTLPLADRAALLAGQGGFTIGAHPTYCAVLPEMYLACPGLTAMEIYNAYCDEAYANGYALELWDMLLGAGKRIWGVAGDDAHLNPEKGYYSDAGHGWVEVYTSMNGEDSVLAALKQGSFFSSQGPTFNTIDIEEQGMHLTCSPVVQVRWRTHGHVGHVMYARDGNSITSAALPAWFRPNTYVRVELVDAAGKRAWSNPFFVEAST